MADVEDVRRIALSLPGATEKASYGDLPSWRTAPRMFARIHEDDGALVLWVASEAEKEALITADPEAFFTTAHYDGHAIVLVRLEEVEADELAELLEESWIQRAPRSLVAARRRQDGAEHRRED